MMELVERYVFWGRGSNDPRYLVIHETANPGATALNHVSYWSTGNQGGEAHYVADWTEKVYHTTPDDRACWHVGGNANSWSVGIELCHATNQSDFEKVWRCGVEFAAWYLESQGWGVDRMVSHHQANQIWATYSDHTDPDGYFEEFGKSWAQFVQEVKERLEGDMPITDAEMNKIAELTAAKVAESAYWDIDKKAAWGPTGEGGGKYVRNNYNVLRFIHDQVIAIAAKIDKLLVGGIDYKKLAKAVNDDAAERMKQ